jgi:hypothetical protein
MSYSCSAGVDNRYLSAGVGYCDADRNHPDWFLTDQGGSRLNSYYFQQAWMMDVGSPGYQARWLSNVLSDLRSGDWDGVMLDDTNADMGWHLHGRTIARYPTSASWRAATRSMLATVGPAAPRLGLPRDPEPLHAVGLRLRRAGDLERLASSSPPARCRSTTRSGARRAPAGSPGTTGRSGSGSRR